MSNNNDGAPKKSFAIGYSFVFHSLLMFMIQGILTTSGNNIFLPYLTGTYGWERTTLLNFVTVAGLVGVGGAVIFPQLVKKFGPRKVLAISLILGGATAIFFGRVSSITGFLVAMIFIFTLSQGWAGVTTQTLIANWFPRKKAVVTGIVNMGLPMASVVAVPVLNYLVNNTGFTNAYLFVGGFMIVLGIASIFWVKDNPEDVGLPPDNDNLSAEQMKVATERLENFKSQWTMKKLLTDRNAWLYVFAFGIFFMVNRGMLSQLSFYFVAKGFTQPQAVGFISMGGLAALAGSNLWGFIDHKLGTKKASIFYGILYGISFILLFLPGMGPVMWIGFILFELNQGGTGKLLPSMALSCYGRYEFPSVMRLLHPLLSVIFSLATWFVGFATTITGSAAEAPIVFAIAMFVGAILVGFMKLKPRTDIIYDAAAESTASSEAKN